MDEILGYFVEQPRLLIASGQAMFTAGMLVIVIGLFGLVARTGISAIQSLGRASTVSAHSLAQIYPGLWTWWVPETLVGAIPALAVAAVGIWLAVVGRKFQRAYH